MDGGPDRPVVTGHPVGGRTACKRCKESVHRNLNTAWKSAKCDPGQEMCSLSVQNPKKVCTKFFRPRHHKKSALSATPLRKVCTKFEMVILYVIGPMSKKNVQKIFIKDAKICQFKKNMPQQQNAKNKYPIHDANFAKKEMQKYAKIFKKNCRRCAVYKFADRGGRGRGNRDSLRPRRPPGSTSKFHTVTLAVAGQAGPAGPRAAAVDSESDSVS